MFWTGSEAQLEKLYQDLKAENIIDCSKKDFTELFKGKPSKGINWKIRKGQWTSKPSLFLFIDKLINKGYLKRIYDSDFNKSIQYAFRDYKGQKLENLKQAKNSSLNTHKVTKEKVIQRIIGSL